MRFAVLKNFSLPSVGAATLIIIGSVQFYHMASYLWPSVEATIVNSALVQEESDQPISQDPEVRTLKDSEGDDTCSDVNIPNEGLTPEHIRIRSIGVDLPVIAVPLTNGTWEVHEKAANYALGTDPIFEDTGNIGIYGHDRKDDFSEIKKLRKDDIVELWSGTYKATYSVTGFRQAQATEISVFTHTHTPTLTLLTCDGIFSQHRYIVKARLVNIKHICHEYY